MQITGTIRQSSTSARATRRRVGGSNVRESSLSPATRRSLTGGEPSQDVPARAPSGVADRTATSPRLGTARPGAIIPELPRNARLPTLLRSTRSQPRPSS